MDAIAYNVDTDRYAQCIAGSKRIRWDIDRDVIRDRRFDYSKKFLPDKLSRVDSLDFISDEERRLLSQVQGRTYANMFGFVERFIVGKMLEVSRDHWLGDQIALEALIRFCDEELKHQELFRRVDTMLAEDMPAGYTFQWDPNEVAAAVLSKSTWAVLGLIYEIELFTQEHYRASIAPDPNLSDLYKDIFLFHWKEEAHHAVIDGLEWPRVDKHLTPEERDRAVGELIELVADVDGILQHQAKADSGYFGSIAGRGFNEEQMKRIEDTVLSAYRWQYIFSGVGHERFQKLLHEIANGAQIQRLEEALAPLQ